MSKPNDEELRLCVDQPGLYTSWPSTLREMARELLEARRFIRDCEDYEATQAALIDIIIEQEETARVARETIARLDNALRWLVAWFHRPMTVTHKIITKAPRSILAAIGYTPETLKEPK
jgi:hypothetical protein